MLQAVSRWAASQGATVEAFSFRDHHAAPEFHVPVLCFGGSRQRFSLAAIRAMARADVVIDNHINLLPIFVIGRSLNWRLRGILMLHGIEAWERLPTAMRLAARQLAGLQASSRYTLQRFQAANDLRDVPGAPIIHPLDPEMWAAAAASRSRQRRADPPCLLTVTRLTTAERDGKGISMMMRLLPRLVQQHPDLRWIVVGDGDDLPNLQRWRTESGLEQHVVLTGPISDQELSAWYARAALFVLPSIQEGLGLVFLEAMIHELAVVATDAGAASEVVRDGETGRLIAVDDIDGLEGVILELLEQPAIRERMGQASRARVEALFSQDRYDADWATWLDQLV
jgi:glycosyltransferase involved in cell wall biosynthesis